ncbi:hypothetical protein LOK49_LG04G01115 [Camellia lanceoleosa]|uniref:Uncharacterized protein n=1 Tax=Camellia lanceoleosa TaxID=1840588 RepID=A0ACC0HWZ3_9ERIC|nr:hypothetical protein LOK49_LG04G01115 [Camellia lanceoleosa]
MRARFFYTTDKQAKSDRCDGALLPSPFLGYSKLRLIWLTSANQKLIICWKCGTKLLEVWNGWNEEMLWGLSEIQRSSNGTF